MKTRNAPAGIGGTGRGAEALSALGGVLKFQEYCSRSRLADARDFRGFVFPVRKEQRREADRTARHRIRILHKREIAPFSLNDPAYCLDFYGAALEVFYRFLLTLWFQDRPESVSFAPLRADGPALEPDLRVLGIGYDLKAVLPGCKYLCINRKQLIAPEHETDFYLPGRFVVDRQGRLYVRLYRPIPIYEVSRWQLRPGPRGWYHSENVDVLRPLTDLEALEAVTADMQAEEGWQ